MDDVLTAPVLAPPVGLSSGPLGAVQAADREIARATAVRARAVAEFAATRPASADRPQGSPGAMRADRWAARVPSPTTTAPTSSTSAPTTQASGSAPEDGGTPAWLLPGVGAVAVAGAMAGGVVLGRRR